MVHVFRLGPFKAGKRDAFAFGGVDEHGALVQPEVAHSETEALSSLARRFAPGPLRCEPALAAAGKPFGFEPAELPVPALIPRATLAFGLALGPGAGRPDLGVLHALPRGVRALLEGPALGAHRVRRSGSGRAHAGRSAAHHRGLGDGRGRRGVRTGAV